MYLALQSDFLRRCLPRCPHSSLSHTHALSPEDGGFFWNWLISEFNLSDLQEVVGYQAFPLECFVTKSGVGENEEGDFDELGQLFLNDNVDDPSGDSFIEKDSLRLTSSISCQQSI